LTTETVLPDAEAQADAVAGEQQTQADALAGPNAEKAEGEQSEADKAKPEKTPEQRQIDRQQRKIDRLVRQREELRAQIGRSPNPQDLRAPAIGDTNRQPQDDSEPVSLSRADLQRLVKEEAAKLAPTIKQQEAEIEHRQTVIQSLAKTWGQEKFDTLAADLDDSFGGLADASGRPKPATEAIFEADDPAALIEFLADPDNADRAEAIGRMNPLQAGRAIAKLEAELAAKKAESKPQPSKAPRPVEALRGGGTSNTAPDPADTKAWMKWANEQERKRA
jgi:hypothetical protein